MARAFALLLLLATIYLVHATKVEKDVTKLQIGVKFKPEKCVVKVHKGDKVKVHYTGSLTDGTEFDSSIGRGSPFEFTLGEGQVIKGWDNGLAGACLGEKRKLKIPSDLGYGDRGSPPKIPGGATLIFHTQVMGVNDVDYEEEGEGKDL